VSDLTELGFLYPWSADRLWHTVQYFT